MGYILSLETSTTNCSVCLALNGKSIAHKEYNSSHFSHSEKLHVFIEEVLNKANCHTDQLDAIAISKGPGSYTGLRIGVSAAKGLCFGLDIPLISLETLKVLSVQISTQKGVIIPMLDARRQEVYDRIFDHNSIPLSETRATVLESDTYCAFLKQGLVHFIGTGVSKLKSIIQPHPNAKFVDEAYPSASDMNELAYHKFKENDFEDVAYFEPFYLKEFIGG